MIVEQQWVVRWFENARRYSRVFESEERARRFVETRDIVIDPDSLTVAEFVDRIYLPLRRAGNGTETRHGKPLAMNSLAIYSCMLRKHIFPVIGSKRVRELTTEDLRRTVELAERRLVDEGRTAETVRKEYGHTRCLVASIARYLSKLDFCHVSPPDRKMQRQVATAVHPEA